MKYSKDFIERFRAKTTGLAEWGCIIWTAKLNPGGYGRIFYGGKTRLAHRVSYEMARGPIPAGYQIDHLCRNRACVNPKHLEVVTPQENSLRGLSFAAQNSIKLTCPRGHLYKFKSDKTRRVCRTCENARLRRDYYAQKARDHLTNTKTAK